MNTHIIISLSIVLILFCLINLLNREYFKTDRDNTYLTSDPENILEKTDSVPYEYSIHPDYRQENIEKKIDDINMNKSINPNYNPEMCLWQSGRNIVNNLYGADFPVRGTDKDDILQLYDTKSTTVDQGMATVLSAVSKRSKEAATNASRMTRNTFQKYFTEELNEQANRRWWDNDAELEFRM